MNPSISIEMLEQLEQLADGRLAAPQAQELSARLERDADLAECYQQLRADRQSRRSYWSQLATSAEAEALADSILAACNQEQWHRQATRSWSVGWIAAAACLALGFSMGWMGRGTSVMPQVSQSTGALTPAQSPITLVGNRAVPAVGPAGPFAVTVSDPAGRIIAVHRFQHPEEARQFIQQPPQAAPAPPPAGGDVKLVSEEF